MIIQLIRHFVISSLKMRINTIIPQTTMKDL